jgi:hypothetical protein
MAFDRSTWRLISPQHVSTKAIGSASQTEYLPTYDPDETCWLCRAPPADDSFRNYNCFFKNPPSSNSPCLTSCPIMVAVISIGQTSFTGDGRAGAHSSYMDRYRPLPEEHIIGWAHVIWEPKDHHAPKIPGRALRNGFVGASAQENKCS